MNRPNRALPAVLCLTLVSLAGCSGSGGSDDASSGGGKVTITFVHRLPDAPGMTKVADIVGKWNSSHPDIQVELTKFNGQPDEMAKKLEEDVRAGTQPCLAQVGYSEVPALYSKGYLMDVTREAEKYSSNFSKGSPSLMKIGDVSVGLPQDTGPLVYFYNKNQFERLGLRVPATSTELASVAKAAAKKGKFALAFQPDEAPRSLSALSAAAGARWYTSDIGKWKVNVTSPQTAKVAAFWQGVLNGKAALVQNRWKSGFNRALTSQKLIGTIGAAWEAPLLANHMAGTKNVGQWRVTQLPLFGEQHLTGSDGNLTGPQGGSGVAVMKDCQAPAQAMEFNNWFNTQTTDLATQGLVPAGKALAPTSPAVKTFYGGQDVMGELYNATRSLNNNFDYMPTWLAVANSMKRAAEAAGAGKQSVQKIFNNVQTESVESLKNAGIPVS